METILTFVDINTCSREDCERMLRYLHGLISFSEKERAAVARQVISFQKRLTQFRIDNIRLMAQS